MIIGVVSLLIAFALMFNLSVLQTNNIPLHLGAIWLQIAFLWFEINRRNK